MSEDNGVEPGRESERGDMAAVSQTQQLLELRGRGEGSSVDGHHAALVTGAKIVSHNVC